MALWGQKLNVSESAVVWDYHVILVLRAKPRAPNAVRSDVHTIGDPAAEGVLEMKIGECEDDESKVSTCASWVYDFDSRAGMPCIMQGETNGHTALTIELYNRSLRMYLCLGKSIADLNSLSPWHAGFEEYISQTFPQHVAIPAPYRR